MLAAFTAQIAKTALNAITGLDLKPVITYRVGMMEIH
jgi:hypothetical protein